MSAPTKDIAPFENRRSRLTLNNGKDFQELPRGFFVTGTDTGVGKTIIAGAVVEVLKSLGFHTGVMKPVESGCTRRGNSLVPNDAMLLKRITHADDPISDISPSLFESPLAPMAAAEIEKKVVDLGNIKKVFARMSRKYEALVIEGVGGLMVPLKKDYYALDLARDFGFPVIVTARPGLGTINHTLLTVNTAISEGLIVAGVVINYRHPPLNDLAEETNLTLLPRILPASIAGVFPYIGNPDEVSIAKAAVTTLDIGLLRKSLELQSA
ncbi:MAG: dethiobiotin synthase [Candidatus Sulfobium sp.]